MLHAHAVGRARAELTRLRSHPQIPASMLEEVLASAETSARRHRQGDADQFVFIVGDDELVDVDAAARILGDANRVRRAVDDGELRPVDGDGEAFLAAEVIAVRAHDRRRTPQG